MFNGCYTQMCHGSGIEDEPLGPGDVNRPNGLGTASSNGTGVCLSVALLWLLAPSVYRVSAPFFSAATDCHL